MPLDKYLKNLGIKIGLTQILLRTYPTKILERTITQQAI